MKKLLSHPIVIIILTIVSGVFLLSLRRTAQKSEVASQNVDLLEEKINQLSGQIETEKAAIEHASSSLAKEKMLRDELLLQKPGEYILQIPEQESLSEQTIENRQQTNQEAWWEVIFN